MQDEFYLDRLYPLQNEVLRLPALHDSSFYLTGGTALGRYYLNHRYSDDLDFFTNNQQDFQKNTEEIIASLRSKFDVEINSTSDSHIMLHIIKYEIQLKIDFVKDVPYRVESPLSSSLFIRTDHWKNILSNKISALSREAAKDLADLIMISKTFDFRWPDVIQHASMKDMWVNELEVSRRIGEFPEKDLITVKWIRPPDIQELGKSLKIISKDILLGLDNSLANKSSS